MPTTHPTLAARNVSVSCRCSVLGLVSSETPKAANLTSMHSTRLILVAAQTDGPMVY